MLQVEAAIASLSKEQQSLGNKHNRTEQITHSAVLTVSIAAANTPTQVVISGQEAAVAALITVLSAPPYGLS